jgi:predicted kinase
MLIMSNPTLYMLVGVPGSGKSTWIAQNFPDMTGCYVASTDRLLEIYALMRNVTYNEVFKDNIDYANKAMMTHVKDVVMYGYNIIWDQTNLTPKSRASKLAAVPKTYRKIGIFFPTPETEELYRRLDSRPGKTIPEHAIQQMINCLKQPTIAEGFDEIRTAY